MGKLSTSDEVAVEWRGNVPVVWIDNPPVNAASPEVKAGLAKTLNHLLNRSDCAAIVLIGRNQTFIAGADLKEFDKPDVPPVLPDMLAHIRRSSVPVVCAIDGAALGGGFEVALSCDYRIVTQRAVVGLPEVTLGVVPGAAGTQILPRLVDPEIALELICSGRRVPASEALALGIVDQVTTEPLLDAAIAVAVGQVRKRDILALSVSIGDPTKFEALAASILKRGRLNPAVATAVDLIRDSTSLPVPEALSREREAFLRLRRSDSSKALRHLFFAERQAARLDGLRGQSTRTIHILGIVGCGTMGAGIALAAATCGLAVTIVERDDAAAAAGAERILQLARLKEGSSIPEVVTTSDFGSLASADLIIEAAFEDMDVKKALFRRLDEIAKPGAVWSDPIRWSGFSLNA